MPPNQWAQDNDVGAVAGPAVAGASAACIDTSGTRVVLALAGVVASMTVDNGVVASLIVDRVVRDGREGEEAWENRLVDGSGGSEAGVNVGALERSSMGPATPLGGSARRLQADDLACLLFGVMTSLTGLPLFSGGEAEAEAGGRRPRLPLFLRREPAWGRERELELPLFVAGLLSM